MVMIVGYQIAKPPLSRKKATRSRRRVMSHGLPSGIMSGATKASWRPSGSRKPSMTVAILGGLLTRKRVLIPEGIGVDGLIQCVRQGDGTGIVRVEAVVREPVLFLDCEHGPGATRRHTSASSRHALR